MKGAIRGGLTTVLGIFTVLGAAGLAASLASQWLQSVVPYLTLVAGAVMILQGLTKVLEDRIGALITMATYAVGVALPVMVTSVFAAKFNQMVTEKIANIAPRIQKASGYILLAAGAYLIYYYYFILTI